MTVIIDGTNGVQSVDGSAGTASLTNDGDTNTGIFFPAADTLAITTAGSERLRVDSAGNMGLGVTPSAWSVGKAAEIGQKGNSVWGVGTANIYVTANTYFDGSYRYGANGFASFYVQNDSAHSWHTAPSGTAGNAITFTQAMTLDASGNLGVGTTSPLCRVDIREANRTNSTNIANVGIYTTTAQAANIGGTISLGGLFSTTQSAPFASIRGAKENSTNNNYAGYLAFQTIQDGDVLIERARITSGGDLLLGTTTSRVRLTLSAGEAGAPTLGTASGGAFFGNSSTAYGTLFGTSGTGEGWIQQQRVDASGVAYNLWLQPSGGEVIVGGTTDNGAYNLQCNGTGVWGAGAYVNGSDERLKDNIQSLDSGLDVVKAMRPVTFQYKPEHSKDQSVQPGFIAQELQQAMAGKAYLDGVVQAGPEYLNVAYQNIIPILTKAIQELKAELDATKARLAAAGL